MILQMRTWQKLTNMLWQIKRGLSRIFHNTWLFILSHKARTYHTFRRTQIVVSGLVWCVRAYWFWVFWNWNGNRYGTAAAKYPCAKKSGSFFSGGNVLERTIPTWISGVCGGGVGIRKWKIPRNSEGFRWCAWQDLNLHSSRNWNLNPTCMPISPPAHI